MALSRSPKARYILIGGFLGAGKSTAIVRLARYLTDRGHRVGLVTNDQSLDLVDTTVVRAEGHAVEEIGDGCFCCRFDSLVDASRKLERDARPTAYIAEPVGCCTDLVATVSYPLRQLHGNDYDIAPLSVMVDAVRAQRYLAGESVDGFSADVAYIYHKQLEEAHAIVVNKSDSLDPPSLAALTNAIRRRFPRADVFAVSARHGDGLDRWFDHLTQATMPGGTVMDLDYDRYARGESALGWLNCNATVSSARPLDGNVFLRDLAGAAHRRLAESRHQVAHLKMTLSPDGVGSEIAVLNLVRNDFIPELARRLERPLDRGELILNLRAEAPPDSLKDLVLGAFEDATAALGDVDVTIRRLDCFRPARPQPTHRLVRLEASL